MFSSVLPVFITTRGHQEDLIEVMRVGRDLSTGILAHLVHRLQICLVISLFKILSRVWLASAWVCVLHSDTRIGATIPAWPSTRIAPKHRGFRRHRQGLQLAFADCTFTAFLNLPLSSLHRLVARSPRAVACQTCHRTRREAGRTRKLKRKLYKALGA